MGDILPLSTVDSVTLSSGPNANDLWLILTDYNFGAEGEVQIATVEALGGVSYETITHATPNPTRFLGIHHRVILSGNVRCVVRFFRPTGSIVFEAAAQLQSVRVKPEKLAWDPSGDPPAEDRRFNTVQVPPVIETGYVFFEGDRYLQVLVAGGGFRVRDNNC